MTTDPRVLKDLCRDRRQRRDGCCARTGKTTLTQWFEMERLASVDDWIRGLQLIPPYRRRSNTLRAPPSLSHRMRSVRQTKRETASSVTCCWLRSRVMPGMSCSSFREATDCNGGDEPVTGIHRKTLGHCRTRPQQILNPVIGCGFAAKLTRWQKQVKKYESRTTQNSGAEVRSVVFSRSWHLSRCTCICISTLPA